jgi:hypothetical protein
VREQAGEQRLVDVSSSAGHLVDRHADALGGAAQLARQVLPLAHAQVVQELGLAALAELVARQLGALLVQVAPEVQQAR